MREILFRGKRKDNDEWVYSGVIRRGHCSPEYIFTTRVFEEGLHRCEMHEVVPETVGRWTGEVDKNGVRIFEGDIVDDYLVGVGFVAYAQRECAFKVRYENNIGKWFMDFLDSELKGTEVIGNIHDNTELLENICD